MIGYTITDQLGQLLGSGQTRAQVVRVVQRLLSNDQYKMPRLPAAGQTLVIALPIGKYIGVNELHIKRI